MPHRFHLPTLGSVETQPQAAATTDDTGSVITTTLSDSVGVVASVGCAIHCAAMPFVIAYLPALGLSFLADEAFHQWMAVACFVIALAAFVPGFRKHGRFKPVLVGSLGLILISVAAFGFAGDCCSTCAAAEATVAHGANAPAGCSDACCSQCQEDSNRAATDVMPEVLSVSSVDTIDSDASGGLAGLSSSVSTLIQPVVPWLTPLGGLILVTAHLLNRRYGCLCGCCSSDTDAPTNPS